MIARRLGSAPEWDDLCGASEQATPFGAERIRYVRPAADESQSGRLAGAFRP